MKSETDPIYDYPSSGTIEEAIHHHFLKNQWTLCIAESCTGGRLAARLTKMPGASDYFLGSIVSYSNVLKQKILGVSEELMRTKGAVSEEVVAAMATGAILAAQSDLSVAVSGIAGPSGGTPQKPVGTIWAAVKHKDQAPYTWKFHAKGNREMILEEAVNTVLRELLRYSKGLNNTK